MKNRILITHCGIETDRDEAFALANDDKTLEAAIIKHCETSLMKDVEVFERRGNVIVTEKGYFFALRESDLRRA